MRPTQRTAGDRTLISRASWYLAGTVLVGLVVSTIAEPLAFMADDSLFYLVIGENLAAGHGATFNGAMPTNGFQPLWGLIVSMTVAVVEMLGLGSPISEIRAVVLVGWALLAFGLIVLQRLLRTLDVGLIGQVTALTVAIGFLSGWRSTVGSEANLVFLLLVGSLYSVVKLTGDVPASAPRWRLRSVSGLLLGLMMLARLDTVFVAGAAVLALLIAGQGGPVRRLRTAVNVGGVAVIVVAPYLLWNVHEFGALSPISADIKVARWSPTFSVAAIGPSGWLLALFSLSAAAFAFLVGPRSRGAIVAWAVPLIGGLTATAYYFTWSTGPLTDLDWYRVPQATAAAIALGLGADYSAAKRPVVVPGVLAGASLALVALLAIHWGLRANGPNDHLWDPVEEVSREVGRHVVEDERIATLDYPGVLALFSQRSVVALDGLTGDRAFQDDLRDLGAPCVLARLGVEWLFVDDEQRLVPVPGGRGDEWTIEVSSWLHRQPAGELTVRAADRRLVDEATGFSLWRWSEQCPSSVASSGTSP